MQLYGCHSCESIFEFDKQPLGTRCPDCLKYDLYDLYVEAELNFLNNQTLVDRIEFARRHPELLIKRDRIKL